VVLLEDPSLQTMAFSVAGPETSYPTRKKSKTGSHAILESVACAGMRRIGGLSTVRASLESHTCACRFLHGRID
jgi:hypothetical protein